MLELRPAFDEYKEQDNYARDSKYSSVAYLIDVDLWLQIRYTPDSLEFHNGKVTLDA